MQTKLNEALHLAGVLILAAAYYLGLDILPLHWTWGQLRRFYCHLQR